MPIASQFRPPGRSPGRCTTGIPADAAARETLLGRFNQLSGTLKVVQALFWRAGQGCAKGMPISHPLRLLGALGATPETIPRRLRRPNPSCPAKQGSRQVGATIRATRECARAPCAGTSSSSSYSLRKLQVLSRRTLEIRICRLDARGPPEISARTTGRTSGHNRLRGFMLQTTQPEMLGWVVPQTQPRAFVITDDSPEARGYPENW